MIKNELVKKRDELAKYKRELARQKGPWPKGNLRISRRGSRAQFFHITKKGDNIGKYIRVKDRDLARLLAQKDYNEKVKKVINEQLSIIKRFLAHYSENAVEDVYAKMNGFRQELIEPIVLSDEEYVRRWLEEPYEGKGFKPDTPVLYTKRGERVRSKSEVIIADMLFSLGIPYKYEHPVLVGQMTFYPDFTILLKKSRRIVIHEHYGMMDDDKYRADFFEKNSAYSRNGYVIGKNLFVTFESRNFPLNQQDLKALMSVYLEE